MSLMSKNKPTKKVDFPGGFVVLQHLSKGVKAEYQRRMAGLLKELETIDNLEELKNAKSDALPTNLNLESILEKMNQAEYFKLSRAIKSWSEEDEISEASVQELDEEVFGLITKEIDEMNQLSVVEEKN